MKSIAYHSRHLLSISYCPSSQPLQSSPITLQHRQSWEPGSDQLLVHHLAHRAEEVFIVHLRRGFDALHVITQLLIREHDGKASVVVFLVDDMASVDAVCLLKIVLNWLLGACKWLLRSRSCERTLLVMVCPRPLGTLRTQIDRV